MVHAQSIIMGQKSRYCLVPEVRLKVLLECDWKRKYSLLQNKIENINIT